MIYFSFLYFILSFFALAIASYTDLKERIVSNRLVFLFFLLGFILKSVESFFLGSFEPLVVAFLGFFVAFGFSFLLYKLGVWASGDVKLVSVFSFVNPINYSFLRDFFANYFGFSFLNLPFFSSVSLPVFGVTLIVYSALSVFPVGLALVFFEAVKRPFELKLCFFESFRNFFYLFQLSFFVSSLRALVELFFPFVFSDYLFVLLFYLVLFVFFVFVPVFLKFFLFVFSFLSAVFFVGFDFLFSAFYSLVVLFFVYFLFKSYFRFKDFAFVEEVSLRSVSEGMIPVDYIKIEKNALVFVPKPSIKSVINDLINHRFRDAMNKLMPSGFFASPNVACGLSEDEAKVLRGFAGKVRKKVRVKKTMAFVPAIFFAFIVLSATGDLLWNVVF